MKPWNNDSLAINQMPVKDNFNAWFGASKAVEASGDPMVLYHGTFGDFETFSKTTDIGFHFGTATAANDRLKQEMKKRKNWDAACSVLPVFLSIQNPAVVCDLCTWSATTVANELLDKGYIRQDQAEPVLQGAVSQNQPQTNRALYDHLVQALEANGFDGLKYRNLHEGTTRGTKERDLSEFIEVVESEWYSKGGSSKLVARYKDSKYPVGGAKGDTPEVVMGEVAKALARTKNGFDFSWIALRPSQIKHAVGNTGLYDATDHDITDRRALAARDALNFLEGLKKTAPSPQQMKL